MKIGRNEPCFCGNGKKYKHCCLETPAANEPSLASLEELNEYAAEAMEQQNHWALAGFCGLFRAGGTEVGVEGLLSGGLRGPKIAFVGSFCDLQSPAGSGRAPVAGLAVTRREKPGCSCQSSPGTAGRGDATRTTPLEFAQPSIVGYTIMSVLYQWAAKTRKIAHDYYKPETHLPGGGCGETVSFLYISAPRTSLVFAN